MPFEHKLGVGRTTRLGVLVLFLLVGVSAPISIVAMATAHEPPKNQVLPLEMRPDYKAGFAAGAAVVQSHYEQREKIIKTAGLCGYAELVCKVKK